jgi:hypothetical protein
MTKGIPVKCVKCGAEHFINFPIVDYTEENIEKERRFYETFKCYKCNCHS